MKNHLLLYLKSFKKNPFIRLKLIKIIFISLLFLIEIVFKKNLIKWYILKKEFECLVDKYKKLIISEKNISDDSPIWMMWYQGINNAPPIVLSCIQSIIENKANHSLILLDKFNLKNYIELPSYITEKFKKKIFSITHYSDIIRMAILSKYGGYWIDSTYFITSPIERINNSFYTLKLSYCFKHPFIKCIWSGNFFAVPKNSFIATYSYYSFLYYWKKYNSLLDYFLIDYIISIAYYNVPEFKNKIKKLPFVNCNIFYLAQRLNSSYNESDFNCKFNKLNKSNNPVIINNNSKTNYGYIYDKYKFNITNNITIFYN